MTGIEVIKHLVWGMWAWVGENCQGVDMWLCVWWWWRRGGVRLTNSWGGELGLWDSHKEQGVLCLWSRHLLTDSGGGRRALELQAWVQLVCPLPGTCPRAGGWAWPRAGASAIGGVGPEPGPGAWFVPGQGWEPCGAWAWREEGQEELQGPKRAKNCGRLKREV